MSELIFAFQTIVLDDDGLPLAGQEVTVTAAAAATPPQLLDNGTLQLSLSPAASSVSTEEICVSSASTSNTSSDKDLNEASTCSSLPNSLSSNQRSISEEDDDDLWDDESLKFAVEQYLFKQWYRTPGVLCEELLYRTEFDDKKRMLSILDELVSNKICSRIDRFQGLGPFFKIINVPECIYRPTTIGIGRGKPRFALTGGLVPIKQIFPPTQKQEKRRNHRKPLPPPPSRDFLIENMEKEILVMLASNLIITMKEIRNDVWRVWKQQIKKTNLSEIMDKMLLEQKVFQVSEEPKAFAVQKKEKLSDAASLRLTKLLANYRRLSGKEENSSRAYGSQSWFSPAHPPPHRICVYTDK